MLSTHDTIFEKATFSGVNMHGKITFLTAAVVINARLFNNIVLFYTIVRVGNLFRALSCSQMEY